MTTGLGRSAGNSPGRVFLADMTLPVSSYVKSQREDVNSERNSANAVL